MSSQARALNITAPAVHECCVAALQRAGVAMITLEDCLALCGLSEEEVLAIAEHEHIPEIAATELAEYLLLAERGPQRICAMIVDDIRNAQGAGDEEHVRTLLHVLHHFLRKYPDACPGCHPWSTMM